MMPVTTMEEIPVLTEAERAEFIASLKESEARIAAGNFVRYDSESFKAHLLEVYRRAKK